MPFADVAALALPAHTAVAPVAATPWKTVTVRPGDTLWDLAIAHRTTIQTIVDEEPPQSRGRRDPPRAEAARPRVRTPSGRQTARHTRPGEGRGDTTAARRSLRRGAPPTSCVPATR